MSDSQVVIDDSVRYTVTGNKLKRTCIGDNGCVKIVALSTDGFVCEKYYPKTFSRARGRPN